MENRIARACFSDCFRSFRLLLAFVLCGGALCASHGQADATYLPIESWVYASLDDLMQRGVLPPLYLGLRPWPRSLVRRALQHAKSPIEEADVEEVALLLRVVGEDPGTKPFLAGAARQQIASVAGQPLQDGFHFAQTTVNDQGRTVAEGFNTFSGGTIRAGAWKMAIFVDGELQRVPSGKVSLSPPAANAVAQADFTPQAAADPGTGFLRGRLLEAYAVIPFRGNAITFGRQSLWWGPARSGATLFSTNAEPIAMVRYDRTEPIKLPRPLSWLGEVRMQALVGRLGGAQFTHAEHQTFGTPGQKLANEPWIHAEKFSFQPRPSLEFSVSRSVLLAGQGAPLTTRSFLKSLFSSGTGDEESDPGDRRAAFDASWVIPGLHGCARVYTDTFTEDEPFPLAYVKESTWISGFSLNCLPRSHRWTLRAEGLVSPHRDILPGFYYFNVHYLSGYTQQRQLIGSWIGREGKGVQVWNTWQVSSRTTLEVMSRSMLVDREFLMGGSLQDVGWTAHHVARDGQWEWKATAQGERWRFPLLLQSARYNFLVEGNITWLLSKPGALTK